MHILFVTSTLDNVRQGVPNIVQTVDHFYFKSFTVRECVQDNPLKKERSKRKHQNYMSNHCLPLKISILLTGSAAQTAPTFQDVAENIYLDNIFIIKLLFW